MSRLIAALLSLWLVTTPALAQLSGVTPPPVDLSSINAAVAAAQTTANAAATPSSVSAAITAATPAPCTAPLPDTYAGSAGTGAICMARPDATRPTQVKSTTVVTANDGTFSGSWIDTSGAASPFSTAPTSAWANIYGQSSPFLCGVITKTATGFTGKCYALATMTLPSTATALLGLVLSPFQNAAAGLTVTVSGRQ